MTRSRHTLALCLVAGLVLVAFAAWLALDSASGAARLENQEEPQHPTPAHVEAGAQSEQNPADSPRTENPDTPSRTEVAKASKPKRPPEIFGTVESEADNTPIPGAFVYLGIRVNGTAPVQLLATTETDREGRFRVSAAPLLALRKRVGPDYELEIYHVVRKPGFQSNGVADSSNVYELEEGEDSELEIWMEPRPAIFGRVLDKEGKGVSGAVVEYNGDETLADHTGTYTIPGNFDIEQEPVELECVVPGVGAAKSLVKALTEKGTLPDLVLGGESELAGNVRFAGGEPVANRVLKYEREAPENEPDEDDTSRGVLEGEVRTDAHGDFRVPGVRAGNYRFALRVQSQGETDAVPFPNLCPTTTAHHNLIVQRVHLRVESPPDAKPQRELEKFRLDLYWGQKADKFLAQYRAGTLRRGDAWLLSSFRWHFDAAPADKTLAFELPAGTVLFAYAVHPEEGTTSRAGNIRAAPAPVEFILRFTSSRHTFEARAIGPDGRPARCRYFWLQHPNDEVSSGAQSKQKSSFRMKLRPGDYRLTVQPLWPSWHEVTSLERPTPGLLVSRRVTFKMGDARKRLDVRLERGGQVRVRFAYPDGAPRQPPRFRIRAYRPEGTVKERRNVMNLSAWTNPQRVAAARSVTDKRNWMDGTIGSAKKRDVSSWRYLCLQALAPGEYKFELSASQYEAQVVRGTVTAGNICDLQFTLEPAGRNRRR